MCPSLKNLDRHIYYSHSAFGYLCSWTAASPTPLLQKHLNLNAGQHSLLKEKVRKENKTHYFKQINGTEVIPMLHPSVEIKSDSSTIHSFEAFQKALV